MIVVSNTTPLIGLASIGRFELLRGLFGELQINLMWSGCAYKDLALAIQLSMRF